MWWEAAIPGDQGQSAPLLCTTGQTAWPSELVGQTGADMTAVTITLDDGTTVEATTANGWFAALWPDSVRAKSAQVTTTSGTTTRERELKIDACPGPELRSLRSFHGSWAGAPQWRPFRDPHEAASSSTAVPVACVRAPGYRVRTSRVARRPVCLTC